MSTPNPLKDPLTPLKVNPNFYKLPYLDLFPCHVYIYTYTHTYTYIYIRFEGAP